MGGHGADGAAERLRRLGGMVYVRGHPQLNNFRLMPPPTDLVLRCAACVQEQRCPKSTAAVDVSAGSGVHAVLTAPRTEEAGLNG